MQHHVSSRNDSKMPWIFEISGFWFPPRRVDHHVLLPNEENDSHWPGNGDIVWTVEYRFHSSTNTLPRCLGVIDVVFLLFANRPELSLFNAENSCGKRFTNVYEVFTCALR